MKEEFNYSLPFSSYINNQYGKFGAVITKSQYAIEIDIYTHEEMIADLVKKIRPDIETDFFGEALDPIENFSNSNIIIVGYPNDALIELPHSELLSPEQFECLKNLLTEIKKHNDFNHQRGYGEDYKLTVFSSDIYKKIANIDDDKYKDNIDELISKLEKCVSSEVKIPDEVIIGAPFNKKEKLI